MDYEDPIGRPDLRSTDRAMLVALSHHQGDSTPLSPDQERLLDAWVDGRLSSIDTDRAAELAKHNVFAAERVLERRLISAASEGPGVPGTLAGRVLRASRSPRTRTARTFNLRWPTFSAWQWSGLGALAAATVAIALFGFQFWQQPSRVASNDSSQLRSAPPPAGTTNPSPGAVLGVSEPARLPAMPNKPQQKRPEQSFQIAMVTLEDRSVLAEGVRRTRGSPSSEELVKSRFRDINIPTELLQRAITSASNNKGAAEHSELMNFLRAQNDTYNIQARILIDSALVDSFFKKLDQRGSSEVRVYDLDDLRADNIRSKIEPPLEDAHFLFLTVRQ